MCTHVQAYVHMHSCVCMYMYLYQNRIVVYYCCFKSEVKEKHLWITKEKKWGRNWQPTLVLLPRESHGQRNLVGCSL